MARSVKNGSVSGSSGSSRKYNMRLVSIKDSYMFNPASKGSHIYAVFTDKKSGDLRAIETTHMYIKDEKRFRQLNRSDSMGLFKFKFRAFETPSGVYRYFVDKDFDNKPLDSSHFEYLKNGYVSEDEAYYIVGKIYGGFSSK